MLKAKERKKLKRIFQLPLVCHLKDKITAEKIKKLEQRRSDENMPDMDSPGPGSVLRMRIWIQHK